MSKFVFSEAVDKEKNFLINFSDIKGRLDATAFKTRFRFVSEKYDTVRLNQIAFIDPPTSFSKLKPEDEVSFVPMEAISDIDGEIIRHQTRKVSESKGYTRFREGDLIWAKITPCMQNGKSAIVYNTVNGYAYGSTEYYVIRPKVNNVLVEYIHILLRDKKILESAQNYFGGSAGQQRVSKEFLLDFEVPIPPLAVQKSIVDKIFVAKTLKQRKETQAKQLLASIDKYLINELGISLPGKDNSLKNRIFSISSSKLSGGRFDPKLYDNNTTALRESIASSKFPVSKLKEFIIHSVAGIWGKDINEEIGETFQKCLVIRATEFDNLFNLNLDNSRVKYRSIQKDKLERIDIQINDLLIEKSGGSPDQPVGRIAILNEDILNDREICYSNFIHKIRVSYEISANFLFCFLKTIHNIKLTDAMQSQTNGIRNLIMSDYFNQDIPVPPIEKQNEIAFHIGQLREQAKQLQKEAIEELEMAKQEVQQIILGAK